MPVKIALLALAACGRGFFDTRPVPIDAPGGDPGPPITHVQSNNTSFTTVTGAGVTFPLPQHAGDLAIVAVFWFGSGVAISNLTDGVNTYSTVIGPQTGDNGIRQEVFVAANIADSATTTVTVSFTGSTNVQMFAAEYSGVTGVDRATGVYGSDSAADSGELDTTNPHDLLVAIYNADNASAFGSFSGFSPRVSSGTFFFGDREVTTADTYEAQSDGTATGAWIVQLVALAGS